MTTTVLHAATQQEQALDVSPGVLGFLVTLALVLACIPLFRSMTSKIRGVQYRDTAASRPAADATAVEGDTPGRTSEDPTAEGREAPRDAAPGT